MSTPWGFRGFSSEWTVPLHHSTPYRGPHRSPTPPRSSPVHAFMPLRAETPSAEYDRLRSEAEKLLITLSAKVRTAVPVSSLVLDGEPDELLGLAAKERA